MANPVYIILRLLRRFTPHFIARRLLSNDFLPQQILVDGAKRYLNATDNLNILIKGTTIAEIGPGAYNPAALAFLTRGAEKIFLVEPFAKITNIAKLKNRISNMLANINTEPIFRTSIGSFINECSYYGRVKPVNGHAEATSLPNESVDLIVSRSVLEHITNPSAAVKEQMRILKKGGTFIHFIDLRDHVFRWPFEMLTFSKETWEKILTNPKNGAGYQNRLRMDDWLNLFSHSAFTNIKTMVLSTNHKALDRIYSSLNGNFSSKNYETLCITKIMITGTKL
jgi:SAM-dependent methyltransferase